MLSSSTTVCRPPTFQLQRSDDRVVLPALPWQAREQDRWYDCHHQEAARQYYQATPRPWRKTFLDDDSDSDSDSESSSRHNQHNVSRNNDADILYQWLLGKSRGLRGSPQRVLKKTLDPKVVQRTLMSPLQNGDAFMNTLNENPVSTRSNESVKQDLLSGKCANICANSARKNICNNTKKESVSPESPSRMRNRAKRRGSQVMKSPNSLYNTPDNLNHDKHDQMLNAIHAPTCYIPTSSTSRCKRTVTFGITQVYEHAVVVDVNVNANALCPLTLDWTRGHCTEWFVGACPYGNSTSQRLCKLTLSERRKKLMILYDVSYEVVKVWEWKAVLQGVIQSVHHSICCMQLVVERNKNEFVRNRWHDLRLDTSPTYIHRLVGKKARRTKQNKNVSCSSKHITVHKHATNCLIPSVSADLVQTATTRSTKNRSKQNSSNDFTNLTSGKNGNKPVSLATFLQCRKPTCKELKRRRRRQRQLGDNDTVTWSRDGHLATNVQNIDNLHTFDATMFDYLYETANALVEDVVFDERSNFVSVEHVTVVSQKNKDWEKLRRKTKTRADKMNLLKAEKALKSHNTSTFELHSGTMSVGEVVVSNDTTVDIKNDLNSMSKMNNNENDVSARSIANVDNESFYIFDGSNFNFDFDTSNFEIDDVTDFTYDCDYITIDDVTVVQPELAEIATLRRKSADVTMILKQQMARGIQEVDLYEKTIEATEIYENEEAASVQANVKHSVDNETFCIFDGSNFNFEFDTENVEIEDVTDFTYDCDHIVVNDIAVVQPELAEIAALRRKSVCHRGIKTVNDTGYA